MFINYAIMFFWQRQNMKKIGTIIFGVRRTSFEILGLQNLKFEALHPNNFNIFFLENLSLLREKI